MWFDSIDEIKEQCKLRDNTWFGEDEMSFFGTEVLDEVYDGKYFITADYDCGNVHVPKRYTVRLAKVLNGGHMFISTAYPTTMGEFATFESARDWIWKIGA